MLHLFQAELRFSGNLRDPWLRVQDNPVYSAGKLQHAMPTFHLFTNKKVIKSIF